MKFSNILVPISGEKADREAIELACKMAKGGKSKVYIVYVIQVKRALPLDAEVEPETRKAEEMLSQAEDIADEQDYEVETELLQARETGPAIVDEIVERNIDLVLMGLGYKRRLSEFDLGDTIPYVLRNAPCRVFILRQPLLDEER
jgi:nucleotide-binding universal stress UspA family protein